ncbi:MAG: hypothetical protein HOQ35_08545 [Acidobacteriaceae bacterium]|nr:hypothetical protein [Acidobacteriaceae bacterium]
MYRSVESSWPRWGSSWLRWFGIFVAFTATAQAQTASPQAPAATTSEHRAPKSSREALQERGIGVDPDSLMKALSHSEPEVRRLAAMRLGTDNVRSATPALKSALQKETDSGVTLSMMGSLFRLAPRSGESYVVGLCQDPALGAQVNLAVANALTTVDAAQAARACAPTLEAWVTKSSPNPDDAANALTALASLQSKLDEDTVVRLRKQSIAFLAGQEFGRRIAAIEWLSRDRSAEAQKALEQAMDTEKDPALRDLMKHIVNSRPAK